MKLVPLRTTPVGSTADIIKLVIVNSQQGANVEEMRRRHRVLDALDDNQSALALLLEDADHATLVNALNAFRYNHMPRELGHLIDDILDAKAPPVPQEQPPAAEPAVPA